ncbi:MAG TPA: S41 family peptidase [Gemmataceae bacterium]|nr:S41 family peptidase [Gemmataceae bacterium]
MPRWNLAWLLGIASVALLGYAVSHSAPPREKDQDYELVRLVVDVLDEVDHKYVRPLDIQAKRKLVEDMVNGGLEHLDPHSGFINEKEYKRFTLNSKGKFGGVGIQISLDRLNAGQLTVISPMVDTPAYEAGVLAGDVILKIDGRSTENMRVSEAVDLITGDPGTKVVLTVLHEGSKEPVELEITRALIEVQSVLGDLRKPSSPKEWEYYIDKPNQIGYVRLISFSETTAAELRTILGNLEKEGLRGLVLDLRTNPGGLLRAAVDISRMFLNEGRIVSTKGRNQQEEVYDAKAGGAIVPADLPVVVLINRLSASASEIVAAALQDHKRAVIVGERSYGKGSVQNIIEMEGRKSALKLTTASYWRPSGKNIHRFPDSKESDEWGVRPDPGYEVVLKEDERIDYLYYRRDRDIVPGKAVPSKPKTDKEKRSEKKPFEDRTLNKALDYLRGRIEKAGTALGAAHG